MMRPHYTYRAARRNRYIRDKIGDEFIRLDGSNWRRRFDGAIIKDKPRLMRGWNYRVANRALINQVRELYSNQKVAS